MGDNASRESAGESFAQLRAWPAQKPRSSTPGWGAAVIATALVATGCHRAHRPPVDVDAQGAVVSVEQGETTVGFARGTIRVAQATGTFKISKVPVTKQQYKRCQDAWFCQSPKSEECSDPALAKASMEGPDDAAAVCVGRENAEKYCEWMGGRLPNLAEWLRAARGASVQEYPWGSRRATCAEHPKSIDGRPEFQQNSGALGGVEGCAATPEAALITNQHAAGAAVSGMQDILITPAELVKGHEQSPFAACGQGQHCLVYGIKPGSIGSVKPYTVGTRYATKLGEEPRFRAAPESYAFRCAIEK